MDPISDFLTRIRNANMKRKEKVDIPFSKIKTEIARVLKEEGYIANYKAVHNETKGGVVRVFLKYTPENDVIINGLKRVSRPGQRVYSSYADIPRVRGAFGITILSTSKGIMTDAEAKAKKLGGELLCQVW
ncbi:Ribosomal protein S8 [Elusimicrobium minutum Pei191]|uniref:Small ribosomal subunit protein uS8 n=1 Tax=Elusimicrobium minutum (strain Pei191) TaxID=445932 RepID=B2KEK7_ELUMP|nr:30S ribosomal protein S8 [Elusimicrobium minutum]ACC98953.1 Ribosomal protein S8 [Elusimicrobium minutum Pei191]